MPGPNPNNTKGPRIKGKQTLSDPKKDKIIKEKSLNPLKVPKKGMKKGGRA